jgi:head-tail adaptor
MANPDPRRVEISSLRWPVTIALRTQSAASTSGIQEALTEIIQVRADVQPVGAMTFYGSAQIDTPITHRITVRWLDWLDTKHIIIRDTLRLDQTTRREIFRVRRVMEIDGRKRFILCECDLELRN